MRSIKALGFRQIPWIKYFDIVSSRGFSSEYIQKRIRRSIWIQLSRVRNIWPRKFKRWLKISSSVLIRDLQYQELSEAILDLSVLTLLRGKQWYLGTLFEIRGYSKRINLRLCMRPRNFQILNSNTQRNYFRYRNIILFEKLTKFSFKKRGNNFEFY